MSEKVSIILPSFNVADYIEECLNSALDQTLNDMELICVDAGSTDGTYEILKVFAEKDKRIRLINSSRRSYGSQVNMGISGARGEYIAVLETDDFVDFKMYESLYNTAVRYDLDYAAADFDSFYTLQNGERYFTRNKLFVGDRLWYGMVLDSYKIAELRLSDYVLWKGIYNREFIRKNKIKLHESEGAAYQDMGFLQQVKTYASRGMYLDDSFYRYRIDRPDASTHNLNGLKYYYQEFLWLEDTLKLQDKMDEHHKQNYYTTMGWAFLGKYNEILEKLEFDYQNEKLSIPYKWFRNILYRKMEQHVFTRNSQNDWYWEELMVLLQSQGEHAEKVLKKKQLNSDKKTPFLNMIGDSTVFIFGCGIRGERLMIFCDNNNITVNAFCDNNENFWGCRKFGFPVIEPFRLMQEIDKHNIKVILSMQSGVEEVKAELMELGIKPEQIIDRIPEGIL